MAGVIKSLEARTIKECFNLRSSVFAFQLKALALCGTQIKW